MANNDADLTKDAGKTDKKDDDMNISEREEQKTLDYKETLKIYVKNINKDINTIWRPIYKVIDITFF